MSEKRTSADVQADRARINQALAEDLRSPLGQRILTWVEEQCPEPHVRRIQSGEVDTFAIAFQMGMRAVFQEMTRILDEHEASRG